MTKEQMLHQLKHDRDLCNFNPMTGEETPISEDCKKSAEALDMAIQSLEENTVTEEVYNQEYFARKQAKHELWELKQERKQGEMSSYNTISWLQAIERDYIHGGDESFDNKRKQAIQTAIQSIEKLEKIKQMLVYHDYISKSRPYHVLEMVKEMLEKE